MKIEINSRIFRNESQSCDGREKFFEITEGFESVGKAAVGKRRRKEIVDLGRDLELEGRKWRGRRVTEADDTGDIVNVEFGRNEDGFDGLGHQVVDDQELWEV
jgi:hypothetical protein